MLYHLFIGSARSRPQRIFRANNLGRPTGLYLQYCAQVNISGRYVFPEKNQVHASLIIFDYLTPCHHLSPRLFAPKILPTCHFVPSPLCQYPNHCVSCRIALEMGIHGQLRRTRECSANGNFGINPSKIVLRYGNPVCANCPIVSIWASCNNFQVFHPSPKSFRAGRSLIHSCTSLGRLYTGKIVYKAGRLTGVSWVSQHGVCCL